MEIPKTYEAQSVEDKWYSKWMENKHFKSVPDDREPFTIVIPPPNVTGVLHMGHMLNNTIQDILVRRARLLGKNACWVPGTDHASIATEAKVVAKLKEEGINKSDLTRDQFLEHAWEWTHKHGGIILEQLKKLGASCDWDRTKFTMDDDLSQSVTKVFVDLYKKGLIYRGYRMVNWDPEAKTTLSDEEVVYIEKQGKLYYLDYQVEGSDEKVTIATTRPETILGDTAVCINPNDERFTHLKGKNVIVPIANRSIPIIEDEYVDMEFGTGCLKITPAHDQNDKVIGDKHKLHVIDIFNDDATLNANGLHYNGKDRFVVRKEIIEELKGLGVVNKIEDYTNKVGTSERTKAVIEPKISVQWFLKMEDLSKPALDNVMNDTVQFHPAKFKNSYRHWMENVRDWNISRQLWWGHQIPAFFYGDDLNDFVVAETAEEAAKLASEKLGKEISAADLKQDPDALDTWFSSWLWPISVFNGINEPDNEEVNYYYPTNDLVTAPEIMFFWVARMIIAGYEYRDEFPFKNVYYTGIVRDEKGRKMSKQLGNSPDPIELINKYGADGVRVGMLLCSPAGNDLPFDESLCEQGRNFSNKIWNALRLVKNWEISDTIDQPESSKVALEWFGNKLAQTVESLNQSFDQFRISEALMTTYKLVWDDFCSWLLEMVKPAYQQPIDKATYDQLIGYFEQVLILMHPFTPFVTEEIWHLLTENDENKTINFEKWPTNTTVNEKLLAEFEIAVDTITEIRTIRKNNNLANKNSIDLSIIKGDNYSNTFDAVIAKLGNIENLSFTEEKLANAFSFVVKGSEYFIPFGDSIDVEAEAEKLKKELNTKKGSLPL